MLALDAVASIIGTTNQEEPVPTVQEEIKEDEKPEPEQEQVQEDTKQEEELGIKEVPEELALPTEPEATIDNEDLIQLEDLRGDLDPVSKILIFSIS